MVQTREQGTSERLPNSYAAAPSPHPEAEDIMDQTAEQLSSPGDRGKRLADFTAQSPDKQPPSKKQHGAGTCSPTTGQIALQPLAAYPTTDNPTSEHSLKAMLMSLQTDLHRELKISINQIQG